MSKDYTLGGADYAKMNHLDMPSRNEFDSRFRVRLHLARIFWCDKLQLTYSQASFFVVFAELSESHAQ